MILSELPPVLDWEPWGPDDDVAPGDLSEDEIRERLVEDLGPGLAATLAGLAGTGLGSSSSGRALLRRAELLLAVMLVGVWPVALDGVPSQLMDFLDELDALAACLGRHEGGPEVRRAGLVLSRLVAEVRAALALLRRAELLGRSAGCGGGRARLLQAVGPSSPRAPAGPCMPGRLATCRRV